MITNDNELEVTQQRIAKFQKWEDSPASPASGV